MLSEFKVGDILAHNIESPDEEYKIFTVSPMHVEVMPVNRQIALITLTEEELINGGWYQWKEKI